MAFVARTALLSFFLGSSVLRSAAGDTIVSKDACAASNWICSLGISSAMASWCGGVLGSTTYCPQVCAIGANSMVACSACVTNMYAVSSYCTWVGSGIPGAVTSTSTGFLSSRPIVQTTTLPTLPVTTTSATTTLKAATLPATLTTVHSATPPSITTTVQAATLPATTTTRVVTARPVTTTTSIVASGVKATTTTHIVTTIPVTTTANIVTTIPLAAGTTTTTTTSKAAVVLPSPRRVLYIDYRDINWNSPTETVTNAVAAGYNVILLGFLLSTSPADMAQAWSSAGAAAQLQAMSFAHSKGAVVMVSAGGSTDTPWSTFTDGTSYGLYAGQWAKANNLDGVDFDAENFASGFIAGSLSGNQAALFLADASIAVKQFVRFVSHAPQAPYFGPIGAAGASFWPGTSGGYSAVEANSKGAVDFYNVQFYNQGPTCYTTFAGLFTSSKADCAVFPGTSVQEIASYGVPMSKITVTKYLLTADASNGYVSATVLSSYLGQAAQAIGYKSGVSCWAYASASSTAWIAAVCSGGVC